MTSLKELLDELEIKTDDLDKDKDKDDDKKKDDDLNLKDIKLDDIPEKQRPIFQKLIDTVETQTNEISRRDLLINSLKDVRSSIVTDDKKDEKNQPWFKHTPIRNN